MTHYEACEVCQDAVRFTEELQAFLLRWDPIAQTHPMVGMGLSPLFATIVCLLAGPEPFRAWSIQAQDMIAHYLTAAEAAMEAHAKE